MEVASKMRNSLESADSSALWPVLTYRYFGVS